jgi:hypothetical protein
MADLESEQNKETVWHHRDVKLSMSAISSVCGGLSAFPILIE